MDMALASVGPLVDYLTTNGLPGLLPGYLVTSACHVFILCKSELWDFNGQKKKWRMDTVEGLDGSVWSANIK